MLEFINLLIMYNLGRKINMLIVEKKVKSQITRISQSLV